MGTDRALLVVAATLLALAFATPACAETVTQDGDSLRSGWYPNEAALTPQLLSGGTFGQIFDRPVQGQVYAQPLLADGVLFVATNDDWIYGLDPHSGAVLWQRSVGPPEKQADEPGGGWCPNPAGHIGILGTPVIDAASETAYFVAKTYASGETGATAFKMHAVALSTGEERPNFPVTIAGSAENMPGVSFAPDYHLQRPGLLLLDGVVYASFGSICDISPYHGWLAGVSTAGQQTAMWATSPAGGSIWQSGGALVSDGPGQILFSTGNSSTFDGAGAPPVGPGSTPPEGLAESVARVTVQSNGSLQATDFFSPFNNIALDQNDTDLGASAPMALPSQYFGTSSVPNLLVQDGKEGYVYLLDRDSLGGMGQGPGGADEVVQRLGPYGGVWDAMASWPGDGGYVYITTVNGEGTGSDHLQIFQYGVDGSGKPTLTLVASSTDLFAFGSGSPVVTSDGTTAGSGILWGTWCPSGSCEGARLRAYAAVPSAGHPVELWSAPIGTANKFAAPGIGEGRVYVGTLDGHLIGYGQAEARQLTGEDVSFPATIVGRETVQDATVTASREATITSVKSDDPRFVVGQISPSLPTTLNAGQTLSIPIHYTPDSRGQAQALLTVRTNQEALSVNLSGTGVTGQLSPSATTLDLGAITVGESVEKAVGFKNTGEATLEVESVLAPLAPFAVAGAPDPGTTVAPGHTLTLPVVFQPTAAGVFSGSVALRTEVGETTVDLTASATAPAIPGPQETPTAPAPLAPVPLPGALPTAPPRPSAPAQPLRLLSVRVSLRAAGRGGRHPRRLGITFKLSSAGAVRLALERATRSRRCSRRGATCTHFLSTGRATTTPGHAGVNAAGLDIVGLGDGRYRLKATPRSLSGDLGVSRYVYFKILRA